MSKLPASIGTYRIINKSAPSSVSGEFAPAQADVVAGSLAALRAEGRGRVRRRLEAMVNSDMIGVVGAQRIYRDAFGDTLKAVKVHKGIVERLSEWAAATRTSDLRKVAKS